ncbi:hypothetical protein EG329_001176 [Mollisiaceae sp. DMI_Dod_QoI]|nr:hypothetical protein EG329_001176 [Helotiales sp. DMI_Dod_QoI]
MEKDSEKIIDPANDTEPSRESVSSAVVEYLQLVNHDAQSSQLGSGSIEKRNAVFRNVKVWGGDTQLEYLETVANFFMLPFTLIHKALSLKRLKRKMILHGIDGIIQEGEMVLVLGPPGSGCTTLLKTLSGHTGTFRGWSGDITYFELPVVTVKKTFRGNLVYNAEGDVHFPYLTVWRTLGFAVQTKIPTDNIKHSERKQKISIVTEVLMKVFGLGATKTTLVGNEFVSGVSGGERKRVSLAEVMSTNAKVSLWDNSTQGLDSTTSVRFGKALRTYVKSGQNIAIAALYQASDDLVNLFDKITLLHEGRQIFFGTTKEAQEYLDSLGFVWSDRQSLSEFFISVTDPHVRSTKEGWENRVPRAIEDWERCWKSSIYYHNLQKAIEIQLDSGHVEHEAPKAGPLRTSHQTPVEQNRYTLSWSAQLYVTLSVPLVHADV